MKWQTLSGENIPDIAQWIRDNGIERDVHIGTDSLPIDKFTQFVTVVALHSHGGRGGRVAFTKDIVPRMPSLRQRLMKEVYHSIGLAISLEEAIQGRVIIHVDANPNTKYASSQYIQELTGMVMGQGFRLLLKPDSWAATHVADWAVRHDIKKVS